MARACTLLLFYIVLTYLAIEDCRKRKISNRSHVIILLLALVSVLTIPEISLEKRVIGMLIVSMPMTFFAIISQGGLGGGDVKLSFACGAFLGCESILKGTVLAVFLAGIYCLWLLFIRKEIKNKQLAFGPFLSIGYVVAAFPLF